MVKKMKDAGQSETQLTIQALQCFFFLSKIVQL